MAEREFTPNKNLDMPKVANMVNRQFERIVMLQELARMAEESLPNSTDSDVPAALLTGIREILASDASKMFYLHQELENMCNLAANHSPSSATA